MVYLRLFIHAFLLIFTRVFHIVNFTSFFDNHTIFISEMDIFMLSVLNIPHSLSHYMDTFFNYFQSELR